MSPSRIILLLTFFIGTSIGSVIRAQSISRWTIPVADLQNKQLDNAFSGGLNSPQFSSIYLNEDTLSDLFVFDRSGGKSLTFLADPTLSSGYRHAPEYGTIFPALQEWALLRDFNGDSLVDIFTYSNTGVPGIDVYVARKEQGLLSFQKMIFNNPVRVLGYPTASGTITNIFVASTDIPSIDDMDGDGDLDILTFQSDGTKLYYYRNLVKEIGFENDTFDFILDDRCWGRLVESFNTNEVILSSDSLECPVSNQKARLHSGSTVTTFDPDRDGDRDVLLGDLTYATVLFLENGGSKNNGWITQQTPNFPNASERIEISFFPATYLLDINHDGIEDLLAAPNEKDSRQNVQLAWYYRGQDQASNLEYTLQTKVFLNDGMLDFGTEANPHFFDYNGDGLKDIIVGSRFHEGYVPEHPSQLFLLENTGTRSQPSFTLVDENWLNISSFVSEADALSPTSVDIDGDDDLDLVIGNKFGKLIFIENLGIKDGPFEMGSVVYPWFDIDVGFSSVPTFVDIDGDGVLDMLVGEERGTINYFNNLGSLQSPFFLSDLQAPENHEEFGGIDARQNNAVFGMSAPTVFQSQDTVYLLVGTNFGNLLLFDISNRSPEELLIPLSEHAIGNIKEGARSKPALCDLDNDGFLDMLIGTSRGGINLFKTSFRSNQMVPIFERSEVDLITLYPNPAQKTIYIRNVFQAIRQIKLLTADGRTIYEWQGSAHDLQIDIDHFMPGLYFASVITEQGLIVKPWIKLH